MQEGTKAKASQKCGILQGSEGAQPMASPVLVQKQKCAAAAWGHCAPHSTPGPHAAETWTGISGCPPAFWA